MTPDSKDRYSINSILRACAILKSYQGSTSRFKVSELARQLRLDRSTTYRLLLSLEKGGLLEKDPETGEYSLGLAAFEIGNTYARQMDFIQIARPVMAALAQRLEETVHLAVLSDTEIVYVERKESPRVLGVISKIGQRAPVYCTALGKVLLAAQPEKERSRVLDQITLRSFTKKTHSSKARFAEELKKVQEQGYGVDNKEHEEDVECIAAPIRDHHGNTIAALSVSGPIKKIGTPLEKKFVTEVKKATALISSRLGYPGSCKPFDTKGGWVR